MSERSGTTAVRAKVLRTACALLLAASAAACDKCGDFWRPIKFQANQLEACRDESPQLR